MFLKKTDWNLQLVTVNTLNKRFELFIILNCNILKMCHSPIHNVRFSHKTGGGGATPSEFIVPKYIGKTVETENIVNE